MFFLMAFYFCFFFDPNNNRLNTKYIKNNTQKHKEYCTGYNGVCKRLARKAEKKKQGRDHNHRREVGKDIQAGRRRTKTGVYLLGKYHTVGRGTRQGAEAHKEHFVLEALKAFLGRLAEINVGDQRAYNA